MSYARFSEGDVYVYQHTGGYLICQMCGQINEEYPRSDTRRTSFVTTSRAHMLSHMRMHESMGDEVPERAIDRLIKEYDECGDSIVTADDIL